MTPCFLLALAAATVPPDGSAKADALARYGVGRLAVVREQLPAAAKNLEAAAKADPTAVAPLRDLVRVYADLGRDPAAIRTARQVLAADPADADTAHALVRLLFAAKRYKEAGDVLAAAVGSPRLAKRPTKRLAMSRDLARCREADNDFAAAAEALRSTARFLDEQRAALLRDGFTPTEIDRQAADAAERLGRALVKGKRPAEAAAAFRAAYHLFTDPARANDPAAAARLDWNLSSVLDASGEPAAALAHLTAYLDRKPTGVEPYQRLADLLRKLGRGGEVVSALRSRATGDPTNPAIRWLAAVERMSADFPAGQDDVERLAGESADPAFFRAAVRAYAAAERPKELLLLLDARFAAARPKEDGEPDPTDRSAAGERARLLSEAVAAEPGFLPALLRQAAADYGSGGTRRGETVELLAWMAERSGRPEQAEGLLREAVRGSAGESLTVPLAYLRTLAARKKWTEVIAECSYLWRRKPYFAYIFRKAEAEAELGRGRDALATIEGVLKDAKFPGRRQKAHVLGVLGRYEAMAAECLATMAEFPAADEVQAMRYLLAEAYLGQRKFDMAEAELRKVLEEDPDDVLALNNLGYNLADQGRKLDEAEELIRRAVELDRDERARAGLAQLEHAAYLDSLGWVLFRKGKLAEARDYLAKAADLPDGAVDPTVWDHLGDVCFRLGDKAAAKDAWAKAAGLYVNSHHGRLFGRLDEVRRKSKLVE